MFSCVSMSFMADFPLCNLLSPNVICFAQEEEDENDKFRTLSSDVSGWQGEGHGGKGAVG